MGALRRWAAPVAVVLAVGMTAPEAHADADEEAKAEAKEHFTKGIEFFNNGEYGAALAEFFWANEIAPHFMVLYNIARCYARLNKHIEAKGYFEQYLKEGGDQIPTKRLQEVAEEMAALEKIIAYLDVTTGDVKGATIKIGDKVVGQTPLEKAVAVEPGPITVGAEADGYRSESKDIVVPAGKTLKVEFVLVWVVKWGNIEVTTEAPKGVVFMDGKEMGPAPWSGKVKAGTHSVEIKAPGYKKAVKEVVVEEDDNRTIDVTPEIEGEPARLTVEANVDGAEVFIEGIRMGSIPLKPLDLPPGPTHLSVKADGYMTFEGDIQLTTGKPTKAIVKLVREGAGVAPVWFWTMASVAVASAIGGTITGVLALQKSDEYASFLSDVQDGTSTCHTLVTCQDEREKIRDAGKTLQLTTDILWGVTAAFGATALVLAFFTRFKPPESKLEVAFAPVMAPDLKGFSMTATF